MLTILIHLSPFLIWEQYLFEVVDVDIVGGSVEVVEVVEVVV